jgi:hypothetical protein
VRAAREGYEGGADSGREGPSRNKLMFLLTKITLALRSHLIGRGKFYTWGKAKVVISVENMRIQFGSEQYLQLL